MIQSSGDRERRWAAALNLGEGSEGKVLRKECELDAATDQEGSDVRPVLLLLLQLSVAQRGVLSPTNSARKPKSFQSFTVSESANTTKTRQRSLSPRPKSECEREGEQEELREQEHEQNMRPRRAQGKSLQGLVERIEADVGIQRRDSSSIDSSQSGSTTPERTTPSKHEAMFEWKRHSRESSGAFVSPAEGDALLTHRLSSTSSLSLSSSSSTSCFEWFWRRRR